ncbi:hypothetical protein AYI69_g9169 [Smittium culicis]|uniref:Uncharacterized protein n=1 Tax=Smittium culicis TaxID=133412 RepID=A0A1R1XEJ3_9FUNG|nr:hypothetical protein AYI69_g9169 [Smittium culicis]
MIPDQGSPLYTTWMIVFNARLGSFISEIYTDLQQFLGCARTPKLSQDSSFMTSLYVICDLDEIYEDIADLGQVLASVSMYYTSNFNTSKYNNDIYGLHF